MAGGGRPDGPRPREDTKSAPDVNLATLLFSSAALASSYKQNGSFECDLSFSHSQISETIRHKIETVENESVISTAAETGFWNSLVYNWSFEELPGDKTEVQVKLDVDIKGLPYAIAFDMLSDAVIAKVFDAFIYRLHGYDFVGSRK